MVVTVFPSNDECVTAQVGFTDSLVTLGSVDNYSPTPYNTTGREKNVTIIIEPALPGMCVCVWGGGGGGGGHWWLS